MSDVSSILVAVCGFGVVCCGSLVLGFALLVRIFGATLVLPAIASVSSAIFNRNDNNDDDLDVNFDQRRSQGRGVDLQARIQQANQQFAQSLNTNVSASAQSFSPQGNPAANQPSGARPMSGHQPGRGNIPGQSPFDTDPNANLPYGAQIRPGNTFNTGGLPPVNPPAANNRFGITPSLDGGQNTGPGGQPLSAADRLRQRGYSSDLGPIDIPGIRRRRERYDSEEEYFGSNDNDDNGLLDFLE